MSISSGSLLLWALSLVLSLFELLAWLDSPALVPSDEMIPSKLIGNSSDAASFSMLSGEKQNDETVSTSSLMVFFITLLLEFFTLEIDPTSTGDESEYRGGHFRFSCVGVIC